MKKKRKKKEFSIVFLSTESTKGKKEKKISVAQNGKLDNSLN
jgi:hypothetical protein